MYETPFTFFSLQSSTSNSIAISKKFQEKWTYESISLEGEEEDGKATGLEENMHFYLFPKAEFHEKKEPKMNSGKQ